MYNIPFTNFTFFCLIIVGIYRAQNFIPLCIINPEQVFLTKSFWNYVFINTQKFIKIDSPLTFYKHSKWKYNFLHLYPVAEFNFWTKTSVRKSNSLLKNKSTHPFLFSELIISKIIVVFFFYKHLKLEFRLLYYTYDTEALLRIALLKKWFIMSLKSNILVYH